MVLKKQKEGLYDDDLLNLEIKIDTLEENLFNTQKNNYENLMDFIADYNPNPSGKLWGNDPDYRKIMQELKKKILFDEN